MPYRVDELATRAGVSVDTVRFYQSRGLLDPPERAGRVAYYSDEHLARLERIRDLKGKGFTLASIGRLLGGKLDEADAALVNALAADRGPEPGELMGVEELAERTGVSAALLAALEREGLLTATRVGGEPRYSSADATMVTQGLALLEAGLPLSELLALARSHDHAMRQIAEGAVDLFVRFVRDPIRAGSESGEAAAGRLVEAFRKMLPATSSLVAGHFQRVLLETAQRRIEREGSPDEIEAVHNARSAGG